MHVDLLLTAATPASALQVGGFWQLLGTRVGFAAAQATQNPICFSLIPELFPRDRTTAMALYNSAIYLGRALSFALVIIAGQMGASVHSSLTASGQDVTMVSSVQLQVAWMHHQKSVQATCIFVHQVGLRVPETDLCVVTKLCACGSAAQCAEPQGQRLLWSPYVLQVPLEGLDLQHVSILFTQGDLAAITPIYSYTYRVLPEQVSEAAWRQLLYMLGPPGLAIGLLVLLTLSEPREGGSPGGLLGSLRQAAGNALQQLRARPGKMPGGTSATSQQG